MKQRPLLIDLCCGAGAVSRGFAAAGFYVIGVDLDPKVGRRYRAAGFPFLCADATSPEVEAMLDIADAVHASPPCLLATELHASARREEAAHGADLTEHPDLIKPIRAMLYRWEDKRQNRGKPWSIENVTGADLRNPVTLNGYMFGLGTTTSQGVRYHLERERKFETNFPLEAPPFTKASPVIGVYGGHVRDRSTKTGGRGTRDFVGEDKRRLMCEAMGIDDAWGQTMGEMSQAVPPAYAEHVGRAMMRVLEGRA